MPDNVSKNHRSWVMGRIRSDDTKPELVMRSLLHRAGFRYSLRRDLPGKPDIVLPRYKAVIFVHGCFWHWHRDPICRISKVPKSNRIYWLGKLEGNAVRDKQNKKELEDLGWRVTIVWECEVLGDPCRTLVRIAEWLDPTRLKGEKNNSGCPGVDIEAAFMVAELRHRDILKKKTGSVRYGENENP